jgi:hypothetical protein
MTLTDRALSSMVYLLFKAAQWDAFDEAFVGEYLRDELGAFMSALSDDLNENGYGAEALRPLIVNELVEGTYFEDKDFSENFANVIEQELLVPENVKIYFASCFAEAKVEAEIDLYDEDDDEEYD